MTTICSSPTSAHLTPLLLLPTALYPPHQKPNFSASAREVNELIEWEIKELLNPETVKETTIEPMPGYKLKTPYFDVQGKVLWGAAAMVLNELKWILNK